jgi:hypothetical protein
MIADVIPRYVRKRATSSARRDDGPAVSTLNHSRMAPRGVRKLDQAGYAALR